MSVSLDSWEGVANTVGRYFAKSLPPYYTSRYIEIAVEIIGDLLGKTTYAYVETCVSLPEPIWQDRGVVFLSVPMISLLINQPVRVPQDRVKYVSRFDIFDSVEVYDDTRRGSTATSSRHERKKFKKQNAYGTAGAAYVVSWTAPTFADRSPPDEFGLDESDVTVLVQTFRLVLMVSHWYQHRTRKTTYRDHDKFCEIEMADAELYKTLVTDSDEGGRGGGGAARNAIDSGRDTSTDSDSEPGF